MQVGGRILSSAERYFEHSPHGEGLDTWLPVLHKQLNKGRISWIEKII